MKSVKELQECKKYILSQIDWVKGEGGKNIVRIAALARPGDEQIKMPDVLIAEYKAQLEKIESEILSAQFEAGKSTYRVGFYREVLGMRQIGSVLIKAHTPELALAQVQGANSVQIHQESGVKRIADQLSQIAEWI